MGALATAAAVTPVLTVVPLPTVVNVFEPPTIILGGYGHSPFHRWWNEIPTGISVLKFGSSYRQYQSPTQDDLDAADITYLGGRIYQVSDDEAAALTAAGYGVNLYTQSIPYVAPVMGGIADSGPPGPNIASISPPPATAGAAAPVPTAGPAPIIPRSANVLAGAAVATAAAVPTT